MAVLFYRMAAPARSSQAMFGCRQFRIINYIRARRAICSGPARRDAVYHSGEEDRLLAENTSQTQEHLHVAVRAAESRKAQNVRVLDVREIASFADYFVVCHGSNPRQIQAISDAVGEELAKIGEKPISIEGYQNAEWILADYGDLLIHIFSEKAREYYDLERLWRHAKDVAIPKTEPAA